MTDTIHLETDGGGVVVAYDPGRPNPWALERCCDDRDPCRQPTWETAYWHALYRARRTRVRQAVAVRWGDWQVTSTHRATRHKPQTTT